MISKKMEELINQQLNAELYSAYLYLSMSSYLEQEGLKGAANWYFVQYKEETDHALYFYKYLLNEGGVVKCAAIDAPDADFKGLEDVLQRTLAHEQKVTSMIHGLAAAAQAENDFRTVQFLTWFINEQAEEETNCNDNIQKVKLAGAAGLYLIDQELGARTYAAATNPPVTL